MKRFTTIKTTYFSVHVLHEISADQIVVSIYLKDSILFGSWKVRTFQALNKNLTVF